MVVKRKRIEVHAQMRLLSLLTYVRTGSALKRQLEWMVRRGLTVCKVSYSLEIHPSKHTRVVVQSRFLRITYMWDSGLVCVRACACV
jgi:hypothetical protein